MEWLSYRQQVSFPCVCLDGGRDARRRVRMKSRHLGGESVGEVEPVVAGISADFDDCRQNQVIPARTVLKGLAVG